MEIYGQFQAPAALSLLDRRLGELDRRYGRGGKEEHRRPLPEFELQQGIGHSLIILTFLTTLYNRS
jgi:hypothetical protein